MRCASRRALAFGFCSCAALLSLFRPAAAAEAEAPAPPVSPAPVAAAPAVGPSLAPPRPTWLERFAREQPAVIRAIEGMPAPAGYAFERRYDARRFWSSGLFFGTGLGLQLLAALPEGITPVELVPCAGPFLSDDSGDLSPLIHFTFGLPACAFFLIGSLELGRGLADARPVWARKLWPTSTRGPTGARALRVHGYTTGREWRVGVAARF